MTAKQAQKIERLLNKSLIALQDAAALGQADWLLIKKIDATKDALHQAMATAEFSYAITNG